MDGSVGLESDGEQATSRSYASERLTGSEIG